MTVAELLVKFAADATLTLAPGTHYQHAVVYRAFTVVFGPREVATLTADELRAWRDTLLQTYAPGTVRRWLDTVSAAFNAAVDDYAVLSRNPLRQVRKPPESRGRERFLTVEERARLLAACQRSRTPALYPLVMLALHTGARKMELVTLRWRDVDLERGMLRFTHTKNGERRGVPLSPQALAVLRTWHATEPSSGPWVFPGTSGRHPADISRSWETARRRAGLTDFRFHDLRHTAASYLAMSGASLTAIAHILGHKTMRMVQRYSHFTEEHTRGVLEKMADQFLQPDD